MAKDVDIELGKLFSVWLLRNLGENKTPDFYAERMVNLRIRNGGITARSGQEEVFDWDDSSEIQGITNNHWLLEYVQWGDFITYDLDTDTESNEWSISHTGKVRFITYWIYTIILTGIWYPRVWDWSALSQLTSSNITAWANPSFWAKFAWFTVVNDTTTTNTIRISQPISLAAQTNSYMRTGSGSWTITFDWDFLWCIGTLSFLWIFTTKTIEYISRDNLTTVGGISSLFSIPISWWDALLNPDTVTSANEFIFYVTEDIRIKTINYIQGNPVPQIAVISEPIRELLEESLHSDQSNAFIYYNKQENIVVVVFRGITSTVTDLHVIYDMETREWFTDMDKYFAWVTTLNDNIYAGSALSYKLIQDNVGTDDFNTSVDRAFESGNMTLGDPVQVKQWRGSKLAGRYNNNTLINREIDLDWQTTMTKQIDWSSIGTPLDDGIGGEDIGGEPIGGDIFTETSDLVDFEREATTGAIRLTGKKARIRLYWWRKGQKFVIDYANMTVRPRVRSNRSDRV